MYWRTTVLLVCACALVPARAQELVLHHIDGSTEYHALADIRSIKFDVSTMYMHSNDGSTLSWPINAISSYAFADLTTATPERNGLDGLLIRPNPATEQIRISCPDAWAGSVTIDMLDLQARLLDHAYNGDLVPGMSHAYDVRRLGAGFFICRVNSVMGSSYARFQVQ